MSRTEIETKLRAKGFCKTVQTVEFPTILTPQERAEGAILKFEDWETFYALKTVVYLCVRATKAEPSKVIVFYK